MAGTRVWTNSGGNNLWNDPNNWSPTGVPISTDTAKFSAASSANCTMNISPSIQALLIDNTYGGVLSAGSNTLTVSKSLTINGSSSFSAGTSTIVIAPTSNDIFALHSTQQFYNLTINGAASSSVVYSSPLTSSIRVQNTLNITNIGALYYGSGFTNNRIQVFGNVACSDSDGWTANPSNQNPGSVYMVGTVTQSISGNGSLSRIYIEKSSGTVSLASFTGRMGLDGPWRQAWLTTTNQGTLDLGGTTCDMELTVWKGTLAGTGTINGFVAIQQNGFISPAGNSVGCITINGGTTGGLNVSGTYVMDISGSTPCTQHDKIIVNGALGLSNTTSTIAGGSSTTLASSIIAIELNSGNDINGHFNGLLTNGIATIGSNRFSINYGGGNGNDVELTYTTNMPPVALCNAQTAFMGSSCSPIAISSNVLGNGSYDQDGSIVTLSATPSGPYALGTTAVQVIATDAQGAVAYCNTTVVVQDTTAPTVPTLTPISIQCGGTHIFTAPTATDNCSMVYGFSANNFLPVDTLTFTSAGTYSLLWYFQDDQGNYDSAYQVINVGDNTAPVPDVASLSPITGQCGVAITTFPTATDNCAGSITATTSNPLTYSTPGTYTITWNYADGNGNSSSQTQTVIVTVSSAPVPDVASLQTVTGECSVTVTSVPTATGNCSSTINGTTTSPLTYTAQGTYTIVWNYVDGNNNTTQQTQTVVVDDITKPIPDALALNTITGSCTATVTTVPTATDNCVGSINGTTTSPLTYSTPGTYSIIWQFNDGNGNTEFQTQTVVVSDAVAPVPDVASLAPITAQCNVTVTSIPTATDNCAGTVTATTTSPLTYTTSGTHTIVWNYTDANGNTTSQTQTVTIQDITAPVPNAASLATVTGQCSATVTTIPTATDNCAGVIQGTTTNPLSYTTAGTYTIVWSFNDGRGNISTQNQTVVVNDNTAPVPLSSSLATINRTCKAYLNQISYPWALDNCKGYIKATTNAPTSFSVGTHTITWVFNDGNGNTSIQTQQVVVTDNTAPTPSVASLPTINRQCNYTVAFPYPTATDNCRPGTFAGTPSQTTFSTQGTHTLVWTYNDNNGNTTTQTQTIVIQDTTKPTLSCKGTSTNPFYIGLTSNGTLSFTSSNLSQVVWSATDNCGGSTTLTQVSGQSSFTCVNANQNFTIGVRATDAMGNFNDGTAYIRIVAGSGNDNDCDGVHNTCDECDGGNDAIDNNNDGLPDCKYPPAFADVKPSWRVGTSQVWVWYRNNNNHTPTLIQYSQLQNLINTNQVWLGSAAFCSSSKSVAEEQDAPDLQYTSAVVVMPNPASQYINIVFPEATQEACTIRISNILGETIVTHTTNTGSTQATINLDSDVFVNGSYTITIDTSHGTLTKQFVVVR